MSSSDYEDYTDYDDYTLSLLSLFILSIHPPHYNNNKNKDRKNIPAKDPNRLCFSSLNENIIKKKRRRKRRRYNSDYDKSNIVKSRISTNMDIKTIYHEF